MRLFALLRGDGINFPASAQSPNPNCPESNLAPMNSFTPSLKLAIASAALAAFAFVLLLAPGHSLAAKPVVHECQHPVITGQEAVNVKGISVKEACKVVRSLGKFLSTDANIEKLYECKGATPRKPGTPVLLMDEFEGWKLKLVKKYNFVMYKKGASFRVTGQDFPVNCS